MAEVHVLKNAGGVKVPIHGKRMIADALAAISVTARVKRDPVVAFILGGGWNKLPVTPQHIIDSPVRRRAEGHAWVVPVEALGRGQEATFSQAESLRLWVPKNIGPVLLKKCSPEQVEAIMHAISVVYEPTAS